MPYADWYVGGPYSQTNPGVTNTEESNTLDTIPAQQVEPSPTLAEYMKDNPDLSPEEYMKYMSQHSEEWAEKYLDYITEQEQLNNANEYTAMREDTAYQRLVDDLRQAGLNPAMMFGSSASPQASGSQGYIRMTEGANSRAVGNSTKLQKIILGYMLYQLEKELGSMNAASNFIGSIGRLIGGLALF